MDKVVWSGVLAVAVVASASAAWFGWGKDEVPAAPVAAAEGAGSPVQLPEVAAELPMGHPLKIQPTDRVLGQPEAPITIVEYASMTCGHCAEFHKTTVAQIEKDWVATGKAKYVLRDLPWDNLAMGMTKVTRCAPAESYYPLVKAMFAAQESIIKGVDTLGEIKKVARMAGLDGTAVEACIKDGPLHAQINGVKDVAVSELKITGTPTTFINGIRVDGGLPYADVLKVLQQAEEAVNRAKAAQ